VKHYANKYVLVPMTYLKSLSVYIFLLAAHTLVAQDDYFGIKHPGDNSHKKCTKCLETFNSIPKEILFNVIVDNFNDIYFVINDKEWYDKIIRSKNDGLAADIVQKKRYSCDIKKVDHAVPSRGKLLKPLYKSDLKHNMEVSPKGDIRIKIGSLPSEYQHEDVEVNILFIQDKHWCLYLNLCNIKAYKWELLDMGMFFDTLTYKTNFDTALSDKENFILKYKKIVATIPFEKNKSTYSASDIRPLYDSLNLTNYTIKTVSINAFSSVEGSTERNVELQEKRAQSIINALQSYQNPSIVTTINAVENWVDFLNDVANTPHAYLTELTKSEIKEALKNKKIAQDLEIFLSEHRKAVITFELQLKDNYSDYSADTLIKLFDKSIAANNVKEAAYIQQSIFEKIKTRTASIDYTDSLRIPQQKNYNSLLNQNAIFEFFMTKDDLYETYDELVLLDAIIPNDAHIKYNICVLKFQIWSLGKSAFTPEEFKKEILALGKLGINANLIKRMLINYEILMCEYYMQNKEYAKKDESLKFISSNYKKVPMSDMDYVSLAEYFVAYAKYDWAIQLLTKKVYTTEVEEDLLFYYLNLTLLDTKLTTKNNYRTILNNALIANKLRYCKLFEADRNGGFSFQLLENDNLRLNYCENCPQ
jgi:hypothetical protein